MIIKVEQKHIDLGIREDPCRCPIAYALAYAFEGNEFDQVSVSTVDVTLDLVDGALFGALPITARQFVSAFDLGLTVKPFEFELTLEEV